MIGKKLFQKKIFFVHIPKTAGTSISSAILATNKYNLSFLPTEHASAIQIIDYIGKNYKKYYSFSFVRNPYDRLNSLYHFLCQKNLFPEKGENWDQDNLIKMGFKAWLLETNFWPPYTKGIGPSFQKRSQCYFLSDENNHILVNDVFKYENLINDLNILSKKIDINFDELPQTKVTVRDNYKYEYCDETIDFVKQFHGEDLDRFGYKFD